MTKFIFLVSVFCRFLVLNSVHCIIANIENMKWKSVTSNTSYCTVSRCFLCKILSFDIPVVVPVVINIADSLNFYSITLWTMSL